MNSLQIAIQKTIIYFDLFDFAPTLLEIEKWLLGQDNKKLTLFEIQQCLESDSHINHQQGFYFLRGRDALVKLRKQKYDYGDQKWKHAKKHLRLLAMMPGVEAIWLANSVAWGNARKQSDIDLVIITTPGKIWTARFFTTALMKFLRQRPEEQVQEKALCLSFYMTTDHLNLKSYRIGKEDIHFSFWATQFYPIHDPQELYRTYQKANEEWLHTTFYDIQWNQSIPRRIITQTETEKRIQKIIRLGLPEQWLKRLQLAILPEQLKNAAYTNTAVVLEDTIIKLHTNDTRAQHQQEWEKRVAAALNSAPTQTTHSSQH